MDNYVLKNAIIHLEDFAKWMDPEVQAHFNAIAHKMCIQSNLNDMNIESDGLTTSETLVSSRQCKLLSLHLFWHHWDTFEHEHEQLLEHDHLLDYDLLGSPRELRIWSFFHNDGIANDFLCHLVLLEVANVDVPAKLKWNNLRSYVEKTETGLTFEQFADLTIQSELA